MQTQSLKDKVYEGILSDILEGVYQPNSILNEKELIDQYKVSKTPVREALVQLCGEGILSNIPRFGYQISMITPSEIVEIIEYRKIIEVAALERCFDKISTEQLDSLKQLNEKAKKISNNMDTKLHWNINQTFHTLLCSFCGNRYLMKALDDSMKVCTRIANQYFIKTWQEQEGEDGDHYKLVDAIENRDLEEAKRILIYDIELIREKML